MASSLVLSFSAISYSGDEPQRMAWQRLGEKGGAARLPSVSWRAPSPANTCLKVFGQTLPLGSFLQLPLLKEQPSMTAVGYEV